MGSSISGSGSAMPKRIIKNDYFLQNDFYTKKGEKNPKDPKEIIQKLEEISGITERRFIGEEEESIELLEDASRKAIANAGLHPNDLDGIIIAHNTANVRANLGSCFHPVPNVAALLKNQLEITNKACPSYDILFGCPGWVEGFIQAHRMIQLGEAKHVLVAGVEVASRFLDPHDVDSMLMADGCGATIISADDLTKGVLSHATFSHAQDDLDSIILDRSLNQEKEGNLFFKMQGNKVYKYATAQLPLVIKKAMDKIGMTPNEVDYFFFHQANAKMLKAIAGNLMKVYEITDVAYEHKIPSSISFLGNTSVATIPTLYDLVQKKEIDGFPLKKGQTYVFASVGAGMHCNAVIYRS